MSDAQATRTCKYCGGVKPVEEFRRRAGSQCLDCIRKYLREYYLKPEVGERSRDRGRERYARPEVRERRREYLARPEVRERIRERTRVHRRLRGPTGRLTQEEYDTLLVRQGGRCAICHQSFTKDRRPLKDHDHSGGRLRGLLCETCNYGLGHFHDSIGSLRRAIAYLRKSAVNGELPLG